MDYILNGQASGSVATRLMAANGDHWALKPWIGDDGHQYMNINTGKVSDNGDPIYKAQRIANANATLRKDQWKLLDTAIMRIAKPRMRVFNQLRGIGTFTVPNGMGKTVLETERMSDITPATISMDGLRRGQRDRPEFDIQNLPLPIIHKDFSYSLRQIMTSRNGGTALDTSSAELASEQVAIEAEKLALGLSSTYSYGGGTIYGLTNFPSRITYTITLPTAAGWVPADTVGDVLAMKAASQAANHYGPWDVLVGPSWDAFIDDDYSAAKGDNTLRERLLKINGINSVETADYLTGYDILLIERNPMVARAVVGMEVTTLQWETYGGLEVNFKVMGILIPQLRADLDGNTGIVHGSG